MTAGKLNVAIIGYEHEFVHAAADFITVIEKGAEIEPNFRDGLKCIRVLDTGLRSAEAGRKLEVG